MIITKVWHLAFGRDTLAGTRVASLCRWISYLGASAAGVPIALIVQKSGWNAYFMTLLASCALVVVLLLPTINLKSQEQLASAQ